MAEQKPVVLETTDVHEVDLNLENFLNGAASASNIITSEKKPGIFSNPANDTFLDNPEGDKADDLNDPDPKNSPVPPTPNEVKEILDLTDSNPEDSDPAGKGRPKMTKDVMVTVVNKLVEKGTLKPFDDEKPVEEYSAADLEELLEANFTERERVIREQTPVEFFDSLPEEMQYAAKYIADGGRDLKGLFRALAHVEETRELTPATNSEEICRRYLSATQFGSAEDIEEEITSWKDLNKLEERATKFKPKLDSLQEQQVALKLQQQETARRQQAEQSQNYMKNVYDTLLPGELNGLKIDKKIQGMLYTGLVSPNYPSVSGKPTNMLGHLLEKYQFVEPNHGLIAEALYLLADPEGYRSKVREAGKAAATEQTVRLLKTEQQNRNSSTPNDDPDDNANRGVKKNTIPRNNQGNNFFKRQP